MWNHSMTKVLFMASTKIQIDTVAESYNIFESVMYPV